MFPNFYQPHSHNETCVALANGIYNDAPTEKKTSRELVMVIKKCTVVEPLDEYVDPPNCVHYRVMSSQITFENIFQSLVNM
jgi:hypothetical protein